DVKCLGFLYLYVGRYPRNNASRNILRRRTSFSKRSLGKSLVHYSPLICEKMAMISHFFATIP
ncbi:MAG: hypothetical protein BECKG1743F_GA0114225_107781, partial [Candidatus Kentron sp. G]